MLEDLHWADRGTLDLLLHLARNLQGARLLIVGTYRDVEVDRAHPLSARSPSCGASATFTRVPLRGLTRRRSAAHDTSASRGQEVPWAQAEAVHRQTEGNPLFVQEVLRYLVEEGFVVREDGRYVLRRRRRARRRHPRGPARRHRQAPLRLSAETQPACSRIAAVIGRDFRLDVAAAVAGLPEDERARRARGGDAQSACWRSARGRARVALPLHARLLPPDALRGDDRAAPPPPAPAGGARARGAATRAASRSTPPSWPSTSPTPPTPPTSRRRCSTASWRRSGR